MVTCIGCGGLIDPRDRFCRWCGGTIIQDEGDPARPYAIVSPPREQAQPANDELCPRCHGGGRVENPVRDGIGAALLQGIFRDDEHGITDINELMSR
jgi:hypothetical protein